jgi:sporulation protein YlmC with PRC-barrel domain
MARVNVEELLRAPVLLRGIRLGQPVDVIFDRERRRAVGLEVHCGDESRRFLPLSVVRIALGTIDVASPFVMIEEPELAFYAKRGATLSALRRANVLVHGRSVGKLADIVLDDDGMIRELVVLTESGRETIAYEPQVELVPERSVRAAS